MILCLADVLTAEAVAELLSLTAGGSWTDGTRTAGWAAREVKRNRQLAKGTAAAEAAAIVRAGLEAHQVFRAASLVRRMRDPMFARYEAGEEYGLHVDDALMGSGPDPLRTDLSVTVFLSPPSAYDGGELVLDSPAGEQTIKLDAGSAVLYPSTFLHRVAPVTRGERRVAVTWVQSLVRSVEQRAILFDLDQARRDLFAREGRSPAFDLIAKSYANLLRLWAES
ncbi:MAG: Fe2+-dependent dioxygenase [Alphaproteobacteria bacterium]|jgi:PKHD-type hydroxylase|nr:Fe2+-dependent dioxygenase [Alphaproteobacteria bacterium]